MILIAYGVDEGTNFTKSGLSAGVSYFFEVYTVTLDYTEGIHADRINVFARCESASECGYPLGVGGDKCIYGVWVRG